MSIFFSEMQAELDSEFNAHYDYLSEAYGPTARDAARFTQDEYEAECAEARARGEMFQVELPLDVTSFPSDEIPF